MSIERAKGFILQAIAASQQALVELDGPIMPPVEPPPVIPPPVIPPPSGGTGCGEFSPINVHMDWPNGPNNIKRSPSWTGDQAMVIHFKAGTTIGDTASFQFAHTGPPYIMMVASLSNAAGCNVCRVYPPQPPILAASSSQTPIFRFAVGIVKSGFLTLQPGADYWITAVWRNGFGKDFTPTCLDGNCGIGVRFDFNT